MSYFPDDRPARLRPAIILPAVVALVLGLSMIHFLDWASFLWPLGALLILAHTVLSYRLGLIVERARSQSSSDFLRGFRQGLTRRPD